MGSGRKRRSQKAGLPPGALVHIGEVKTAATAMSLTRLGAGGIEEFEITDLAEIPAVDDAFPVIWLNVLRRARCSSDGRDRQTFRPPSAGHRGHSEHRSAPEG